MTKQNISSNEILDNSQVGESWKDNPIKVVINDYGNEVCLTALKYIGGGISLEGRSKQWLKSGEKLYSFISQEVARAREEERERIIKGLEKDGAGMDIVTWREIITKLSIQSKGEE